MVNASPGSGQTPIILLVEDNPGDARLAREAFDETEHSEVLDVVSDGDEALDYVHQRGEYTDARTPDLILLDWHLPGTSGDEVLRELKGDPHLRHVPVITLTGSQAEREVVDSYTEGANACVRKPADPDELIEVVRVIENFWLVAARLPNPDGEEAENGTGQLG